MSWTAVRPYFNTHLDSLGLTQWVDGFNVENIPSSIIDGAYHVSFGPFTGESLNQSDQESIITVIVKIFKKGFLDPQLCIDESIAVAESLLKKIVKPINRLNESFKNVIFIRMELTPLSDSNDNAVLVEMEFSVRSILEVRA